MFISLLRRFIFLIALGFLIIFYYIYGFNYHISRYGYHKMAALQPLKHLIVGPVAAKHTSTVIFLHGLGDSGAGWESVAEMLSPMFPQTKWVLPHAPNIPITINGGMRMPGWYDIHEFDNIDREEDETGMLVSVKAINDLITAEVDAGITPDKIVLGGFSQGCAVALLTGLTSERKVGGILCMSGYLPLRNKMKAMMSDHARKIPLFWGHGTQDTVVQYKYGVMSSEFLKKELKVADLDFRSYNMAHSATPEEIDDAQAWLLERLPPQ